MALGRTGRYLSGSSAAGQFQPRRVPLQRLGFRTSPPQREVRECHRSAHCNRDAAARGTQQVSSGRGRPSTCPSRGRWSTVASTPTARDCPASTPTPPHWTRSTNSNRAASRRSSGWGCTNPTNTRCKPWPTSSACTNWPSRTPCTPTSGPKLERYDNTLFLVLKTINYVEHESVAMAREIVETGEIMIFVGPDFVVTVRHGDHGGLAGVRKRMDSTPANCALGPYAVMHAIADHVVDSLPRRHRSRRDRHRRDGGERLLPDH